MINYCITVHNELTEFGALIAMLVENKLPEDKIFVLHDGTDVSEDVYSAIQNVCEINDIVYFDYSLYNDFSQFKNKLKSLVPEGEYIFQLDADEMITMSLVKSINGIVKTNDTDLIYISRRNLVEGITKEHLVLWQWTQDENGFINYPDLQGRLYKNLPYIKWEGKVHERIVGAKTTMVLPDQPYDWAILHNKTIEKQEIQNKFYDEINN